MSYAYYDENGWVADAASISGWKDLSEWLRYEGRETPVILDLLDDGYCENPTGLAAALGKLSQPFNPDVREAFEALVEAAKSATGILILSDGSGIEDGA